MNNVKRINNPEEEVKYFKDEKSAYEFFLTKMDGHQRHDILQITEGMYSDAVAAKKWYDSILAKLGDEPDSEALLKLDYIYKIMTDDWDSEDTPKSESAVDLVVSHLKSIELTTDRHNQYLPTVAPEGKLLRVRFEVLVDDYRPVKWPIKHPYWMTAQGADDNSYFLVAYTDKVSDIYELWPEARDIDVLSVEDSYRFGDRFPRPEWFNEDNTVKSLEELESMIDEGLESPANTLQDHQAEQLTNALRSLYSGGKDIIQVRTFDKKFKFIIPLDILIEQQPFSGAITMDTLKEIIEPMNDDFFPWTSLSDEKELELMEPLFTYLKFTDEDKDLMSEWDLVDIIEELAKQKRFDNVYLSNAPTPLDWYIHYFTHKDPNMIAEVYRLIKAVIGELHSDYLFEFGLSVMNDFTVKYEKDAELIVVEVQILAAAKSAIDFPSKSGDTGTF